LQGSGDLLLYLLNVFEIVGGGFGVVFGLFLCDESIVSEF
jgi:hypothetical protein